MRLFFSFALLGFVGCQSDTFAGSDAGDAASDVVSDASADSGACPDESGDYSVTFSGQGCGAVSATTACITQTSCSINIGSGLIVVGDAGDVGLSGGPIPLGLSGGFDNAAIKEGSSDRSGCIGSWNTSKSTLTITCGGDAGSQICVATLLRTGKICPS